MQAGRPLLMVTDGVNWLDLRSVLIVWKDTPEARRAVVDALPRLRNAKDITIVELPEYAGDGSATMGRVTDVATWLARHGLAAIARIPEAARNQTAAAQLEKIAYNIGAGLIVAGAYGHSRFRELILGGATHDLMTQSAPRVAVALTAGEPRPIQEDAPCTSLLNRPSAAT
ncbi:universal stress protein [Bradyrhizobium sp. 137]|uniref:universal stress protein n=1 Tax=Bradyrhizobium sp. 137 TaxID=2782614 RepID=UPI001FFA5FAA|nr:universal stress protein [Bradyrhizobium sp. 137]